MGVSLTGGGVGTYRTDDFPVRISPNSFVATGGTAPTLAAQNSNWPVWSMDSGSTEIIATVTAVPDSWNTFAIDLLWANAGGGSGDVVWKAEYAFAGDGDSIAAAALTAGSNTVAAAPAGNLVELTTLATDLAVTDGKFLIIRVQRVGGNGSDNLGNDANVAGVALRKVS